MSVRAKTAIALVIWTVAMFAIWITKHPKIGSTLSAGAPYAPDHGLPQLVTWLVGVGVILVVALVASRRATRP